jgi:hypothetical protein
MLENADLLMEEIKQSIDNIISQDAKLQKFLVWGEQKSYSIKSKYKPAAVRAFYLGRDYAHIRDLDFDLDFDLDLDRSLDDNRDLERERAHALSRNPERERGIDRDRALSRALFLARNVTIYLDVERALALDRALALALERTVESFTLHSSLQQLKDELPDTSTKKGNNFYAWWEATGQAWTNQLILIAIEHCNICHDWQFSEVQKTLLQHYYDANQLLVDCLNSDCYVSREIRESIESTLLLPIASIEKIRAK